MVRINVHANYETQQHRSILSEKQNPSTTMQTQYAANSWCNIQDLKHKQVNNFANRNMKGVQQHKTHNLTSQQYTSYSNKKPTFIINVQRYNIHPDLIQPCNHNKLHCPLWTMCIFI